MNNRYNKLGIKQTIQKHWMDYTLNMLLAGLSEQEIRSELDTYLSTQKQSGGIGERGQKTYGMAISILSSWISPEKELIPFRDKALNLAKVIPDSEWLPLHWAVISASYPFWFNTAKQTGKLFNLQEKITNAQVFNRLKEFYGDRETVSRNARYTVRSFVAWGILQDTEIKGVYTKTTPFMIDNPQQAILLFESYLHTLPEAKAELGSILHNPGFFPFQIQSMTGEYITQNSDFLEVSRYSLDNEILKLRDI
ncbi:MAG: hypothetical protein RBR15_16430 [Sphaerochaeta sp.]|nr:hypothetical protein [Sphaerochaeta sp.]